MSSKRNGVQYSTPWGLPVHEADECLANQLQEGITKVSNTEEKWSH